MPTATTLKTTKPPTLAKVRKDIRLFSLDHDRRHRWWQRPLRGHRLVGRHQHRRQSCQRKPVERQSIEALLPPTGALAFFDTMASPKMPSTATHTPSSTLPATLKAVARCPTTWRYNRQQGCWKNQPRKPLAAKTIFVDADYAAKADSSPAGFTNETGSHYHGLQRVQGWQSNRSIPPAWCHDSDGDRGCSWHQ